MSASSPRPNNPTNAMDSSPSASLSSTPAPPPGTLETAFRSLAIYNPTLSCGKEENAIDNLLYFYPPTVDDNTKMNHVGLCVAVMGLVERFRPGTLVEEVRTRNRCITIFSPIRNLQIAMDCDEMFDSAILVTLLERGYRAFCMRYGHPLENPIAVTSSTQRHASEMHEDKGGDKAVALTTTSSSSDRSGLKDDLSLSASTTTYTCYRHDRLGYFTPPDRKKLKQLQQQQQEEERAGGGAAATSSSRAASPSAAHYAQGATAIVNRSIGRQWLESHFGLFSNFVSRYVMCKKSMAEQPHQWMRDVASDTLQGLPIRTVSLSTTRAQNIERLLRWFLSRLEVLVDQLINQDREAEYREQLHGSAVGGGGGVESPQRSGASSRLRPHRMGSLTDAELVGGEGTINGSPTAYSSKSQRALPFSSLVVGEVAGVGVASPSSPFAPKPNRNHYDDLTPFPADGETFPTDEEHHSPEAAADPNGEERGSTPPVPPFVPRRFFRTWQHCLIERETMRVVSSSMPSPAVEELVMLLMMDPTLDCLDITTVELHLPEATTTSTSVNGNAVLPHDEEDRSKEEQELTRKRRLSEPRRKTRCHVFLEKLILVLAEEPEREEDSRQEEGSAASSFTDLYCKSRDFRDAGLELVDEMYELFTTGTCPTFRGSPDLLGERSVCTFVPSPHRPRSQSALLQVVSFPWRVLSTGKIARMSIPLTSLPISVRWSITAMIREWHRGRGELTYPQPMVYYIGDQHEITEEQAAARRRHQGMNHVGTFASQQRRKRKELVQEARDHCRKANEVWMPLKSGGWLCTRGFVGCRVEALVFHRAGSNSSVMSLEATKYRAVSASAVIPLKDCLKALDDLVKHHLHLV